jgi:hypothetical protein
MDCADAIGLAGIHLAVYVLADRRGLVKVYEGRAISHTSSGTVQAKRAGTAKEVVESGFLFNAP